MKTTAECFATTVKTSMFIITQKCIKLEGERHPHDISLVYRRDFLSTIRPRILKCILSNTL